MNQLNALLKEFCPNGVAYKPLDEILNYEQPTKYCVKSIHYNDSYQIPVLTAGQTFILGYINEQDGIYTASKKYPVILFDDFTTSIQWVDFAFKVKSSAMKLLTLKDNANVNLKYVYYAMKTIPYIPGTHTRQWITCYSKFEIPLPPIQVQHEMVRILDLFTNLIDLLKKEWFLRQKQYAYYQDKLLTFPKSIYQELESVTVSLTNGLNPRKFFELNTDDATNYYVTVREIQHHTILFSDKTDRINHQALQLCNHRSHLEKDDVLFTSTGTIGEVALIEEEPTNWNIKEGIYAIKPIKSKLNPKFLQYVLTSTAIHNEILKKAQGSIIKSISMKDMKKLKIPVPSLEEQTRIVSLLDPFDKLCHDLKNGLPAEIEARQKQYLYYRDKLLTFN